MRSVGNAYLRCRKIRSCEESPQCQPARNGWPNVRQFSQAVRSSPLPLPLSLLRMPREVPCSRTPPPSSGLTPCSQSAADSVVCQVWHNAEPGEKRSGGALKAGAAELLLQIILLEIDGHEGEPWRRREFSPHQALALPCLGGGMIHFKDAYASGMGIAERESVEPGAQDDDLPNPSLDSF